MGGEGFGEVGVISLEVIGIAINVPPLSGQEIMNGKFGCYIVEIMVLEIWLKVCGVFMDRGAEHTLVRLEV